MSIHCTRCDGTGFLNIDQVPEDIEKQGTEAILNWLEELDLRLSQLDCTCHQRAPCGKCELAHDVAVCDCCGDGESWHGEPGQHYGAEDPQGPKGPYANNGGLCQCH